MDGLWSRVSKLVDPRKIPMIYYSPILQQQLSLHPYSLPSQFQYLTVSTSSTPHSNPPQLSSPLSAHPSSPPPHSSSNNPPTGLSTQLLLMRSCSKLRSTERKRGRLLGKGMTRGESSWRANHFQLAGSVPLLPFIKGRDVLIFQSLPSSGLTAQDSYDTKQYNPIKDADPLQSTTVGIQGKLVETLAYRGKTNNGPLRPPAATAMTRLRRLSDLALRCRSSSQGSHNDRATATSSFEAKVNAQERAPETRNVLRKKNSIRRKRVPNMYNAAGNPAGNGQNKRAPRASFVPSRGQVQGPDCTADFVQVSRLSNSLPRRTKVLFHLSRLIVFLPSMALRTPLAPSYNTNQDSSPFGIAQRLVLIRRRYAPNLPQDNGDSMYVDPPVAGGQGRRLGLDDVCIPQANLFPSTAREIGGLLDSALSFITQHLRSGHPMRTPSSSIHPHSEVSHNSVPAPQFTSLPFNNSNSDGTMKDRGSPKPNKPAMVVPDTAGAGGQIVWMEM
ncbi:hypothetical protein I307_05958 [Cryptococcus deuterogattii 99/473]|uniref:Uncharacterized protein n=1 Tax=Cryptococcus deuterogattii Ram5 TaxID=1296110 RepID=A0A0D0U0A3_9TREE|nr:hypothetical protein I313_02721 [Cryptococcus deuterogattii Ram5]KIY54678.1 hypothetical protein I307_05958 [Cryptococcus deuterogattii 99/473]